MFINPATTWAVLVPVKQLRDAKSRLQPLDPASRRQLALAMARDTVKPSQVPLCRDRSSR
jgi:2-phospho-L-lactate guanylyltransferase (CobY/MobA/RfbA family)